MDFDLTEEQQLLKDSIASFLTDTYDFDSRKRFAAQAGGFSKEVWGKFAELGLLGLPFSEADGGFGGGAVETMLVMEQFGKALVLEPYLATVILGGGVLRHAGSAEQKAALIPAIAEGSLTLALATTERFSRYDLFDVQTTAKKDGSSWVLDGEKSVVVNGATADKIIVTARTSGARRDKAGIGLFLVPGDAPGVTRRDTATQDGTHVAEITLTGVRVGPEAVIGDPAGGLAVVERVADEAIAALSAEALGAMEELHNLTVDYLKQRKQFGINIGSFQALQHRAAEMFVALEQARSMAMLAAMTSETEDVAERQAMASAAKVQIGRSAKFIGQQAVQLHGGIAMTMEYKGGHYFKRLTMIDTLFGDADHHLSKVAEYGQLVSAA
ncbi:pimeloyl-CoA dehydrogenase small subunit [Phreatobacter aquaticus]|uniref:Pimeloyl-CoA dehydrogenase small subunit n=1 Tax=Phreatobacter aquaticus TaxID=2570229 RepID=A0A4D7QDR9_9HYPH|nr:acyl-CoA dehydrogenase family protein [Phreatobacter aquaticus]QCK84601.1 pimeloyl-CoA dehydrogenase small subunit [Phreatobacter aquaticus]